MRRFNAQPRAGRIKDEALRFTQSEFLAGPVEVRGAEGAPERRDVSHPSYWAYPILAGDWRQRQRPPALVAWTRPRSLPAGSGE